jgi:hypothetical protein
MVPATYRCNREDRSINDLSLNCWRQREAEGSSTDEERTALRVEVTDVRSEFVGVLVGSPGIRCAEALLGFTRRL